MRSSVALGLIVGLIPAAASTVFAEVLRWEVDGEVREAIVYLPTSSERDGPVPVVLAFHGYGDNMQNFQRTNIHAEWPEAIVAYFQGRPTRRGLPGWQVESGTRGDGDLELVDVALASLRSTYDIDDGRIYATGFSNGGMFTYLLWAERPGVFAAFAPVAARLRPSVRPTQPKPLFHVAGDQDRVVGFSDQQAAIDVAIDVNGVGSTTRQCGVGCTIYGPATVTPVMTWIHPGGHIYPRQTSQRIVSFFHDYHRE